jgi:hypothetical protein
MNSRFPLPLPTARTVERMLPDEEANDFGAIVYAPLTESEMGRVGSVTARGASAALIMHLRIARRERDRLRSAPAGGSAVWS